MPIVKRITLLLVLLSSSCFAQQSSISTEQSQLIKEKIATKASVVNTIFGKFRQYKHLSFMENDFQSSGMFYFSSPNKIKWSYLKPYHYSVIFKNNTLFVNDAGKKNQIDLGKNELFAKLNDLIVNSINGEMLANNNFKAQLFEDTTLYIAKLQPTSSIVTKLFRQIILYFDKETLLVNAVKLIGNSGDYTKIYFDELKINHPIDEAVFTN